jgi:tRNA A-37 threonylcarbamoyl transferase component Bud32
MSKDVVITMSRPPSSEPLRESVRSLAAKWEATYLLRSEALWWYFDPAIDRPIRRQGWKLHISAVPVSALKAIRLVADVVMPRGLPWKVARSVGQLMRMCSPPSSITQVGKFITIYPDHNSVEDLAAELHEVTKFFDGPVIPSDKRYRRGSNVYLRYGAFSPMSSYEGPEQARRWFVVDPTGRRFEDSRVPGHYAPPWVITKQRAATERPTSGKGQGLFGRDIAVLDVLRQSAKGGVYRIIWRGEQAVLKEGRVGTCADLLGRDARSRLLNEWNILQRLKGTGLAPEPLNFFFEEGNAYLIEEYLSGTTLRSAVRDVNYCGPLDTNTLMFMSRKVSDLAARVESLGVLLRDLTPNNVMVLGDRYAVIDLELSSLAGSAEPQYEGWTPGYARPANNGRSPDAGDVEYALAAISHFILTGVDPYLNVTESFSSHLDAVLHEFGPGSGGIVAAELEQVRTRLAAGGSGTLLVRQPSGPAAASQDQIVADAVTAGHELVQRVEWDSQAWPWPEKWSPGSIHPASFIAGTAGIVQYYLDLWEATKDREWVRHADDLLEWTFDTFPFVPSQSPPGLYFGLGAMPWLMAKLAAVADNPRAPQWSHRATEFAAALVTSKTETWDVTHGWAGIGIAQLGVLHLTGDAGCRNAAERIMQRIVQNARDAEGLAVWPRGDRCYYGFAHGSAGIGYFLLTGGSVVGDASAVDMAIDVGRAMLGVGVPLADGRGLTWRQGPHSSATPWTHWCNGAAGVGLFLFSLWSATGNAAFFDAAIKAGRAITLGRPFGSCCLCHGLAGDGDYLLELSADMAHGAEFQAGAERIGRKLDALKIHQEFAVKWPHEGNGEPRPGYMRGYTGVHSFRLRLAGLIKQSPLMLPPYREATR